MQSRVFDPAALGIAEILRDQEDGGSDGIHGSFSLISHHFVKRIR